MANTNRVAGLKGMIYSKYKNEADCAKALGWNRQKLNSITNGNKRPDIDELNALSLALNEPITNITVFFYFSSHKTVTRIKKVVAKLIEYKHKKLKQIRITP